MKVVQLLGLPMQGHGLPLPQELWPYQSLFSSWQSEGLFSQSFSEAPPIQALRGPPCLGSFSVVQAHQAHRGAPLTGVQLCRLAHQALKGAPFVESYSVDQCISHLKEHPGWDPAL